MERSSPTRGGPAPGRLQGITIRDYHDRDWEAVAAIHDHARPEELGGSCDPRGFIPLATDTGDLEDFRRSWKWVAVEAASDKPVAFAGVDGTYVSWLYVDPPHAGRGIGRALLRIAIGEVGAEAWTIALEGNARARKLYESEGFAVTKTFDGANNGYPCRCVRLELRQTERSRM
jgi:ribosomal protein S18 acetylase RimI-like enzyme